MTRIISLIACILPLTGCADQAADTRLEAADRWEIVRADAIKAQPDRPRPTALATLRREIISPFGPQYPNRAQARWWRQQASVVAEGDLRAVRAEILAVRPADIEALRRTLISSGIDPGQISASAWPVERRGRPAVIFTRTVTAPVDCAPSTVRAWPNDATPILIDRARCGQHRDLAAMVADPADLMLPARHGNADGAYLASAIGAWRSKQAGGTPTPAAAAPASSLSTSAATATAQ